MKKTGKKKKKKRFLKMSSTMMNSFSVKQNASITLITCRFSIGLFILDIYSLTLTLIDLLHSNMVDQSN